MLKKQPKNLTIPKPNQTASNKNFPYNHCSLCGNYEVMEVHLVMNDKVEEYLYLIVTLTQWITLNMPYML